MELTLGEALQRGVEAQKAGKVQEADQYYTAVLNTNPLHPNANHNMGVLAVSIGKIEESLPFFKKALNVNPSIAQYWLSYVDTLIKLNRLEDAKAAFDQAKSKDFKGNGFDQLEKKLSQQRNSNLQTAQDPLPHQLKPLINLHTQGKYTEALSEASQLLLEFPKSVNLYNIIGAANQGLGKMVEAIEAFKNALSIKSDYADVYNNMGVVLKNQGMLEEAIEAFKKAQSINPEHADAYNNMGNALQNQGKIEEAMEAYKKTVSINANHAMAYNNIGLAFKEQGKLNEAIYAYSKALSLQPHYADAYNNMGVALKDQGKLEEAIDAYKKAISLQPNLDQAWNNLYIPLKAIKQVVASDQDIKSLHSKTSHSEYSKIGLSILQYRLDRGHENEIFSFNEALNNISNAKILTIQNPKFSKSLNTKSPALTDKIVALVHFGRSGTGLMHSLLDGHPEISTMPSIYFSEYFDHSTWEKITSFGWSGMVDRFIAIYDILFNASSTVPIASKSKQSLYNIGTEEGLTNVGNQRDEVLTLDRDIFKSELNSLMEHYREMDAFVFFKLVHAAYDKVIKNFHKKSLIFYHIHNPDTYAHLNFTRFAKKASWVMMVREPVQSCESWVLTDYQQYDYSKIVNKIISMLFEIDSVIYHKHSSIGVRLEDLKERPHKTIAALCEWMGIGENESLYQMTVGNKKWWGDPSSPDYSKDGMKPFGKTSIKRKVGLVFSKNDQLVLNTLFFPFNVRFGYTTLDDKIFQVNLQRIRPKLDDIFDFEKKIIEETDATPSDFMKSGTYLYFRSCLIERWSTLNQYHTYPQMIMPLKI